MFRYAIDKSFAEMQETLEQAEQDLNNETLKKEVNFRIGTFLHWVFDYYEWLEKNNGNRLDQEDISFMSGLRYANNKLKHDAKVVQIYRRTGGFTFPLAFSFESEIISFKWGSIESQDTRNMNQYKNYNAYINNHEILCISEKVLEILKKME